MDKRCRTTGCNNEVYSGGWNHCNDCLNMQEIQDRAKEPEEGPESVGSGLFAYKEDSGGSVSNPLEDKVLMLELSVATLGEMLSEQKRTIENITSCLAGTIETIELLRKLGE